jgi:hypothetical protein
MPPRMGRVRNGGQRDGLFRWSPDGDVRPAETLDNPRVRDCPICRAPVTKACRMWRRGRMIMMNGYHSARTRP